MSLTITKTPRIPDGKGWSGANPWANDYTLMALSLWWVQRTQPTTAHFEQDVATVMASLARQLR